jgi:hypothetical protein
VPLLPGDRDRCRQDDLSELLEGLMLPVVLLIPDCNHRVDAAMPKRFVFRIRTKTGGIISNVSIAAKDPYEAENLLRKRYPDCEILNCEAK